MDRRSWHRPQHILVVDDCDDIRNLWTVWLTHWGFSVAEARNGVDALRKAEAQPPDLVLMDLWMPVLNGFDATARLRMHPATSHVPVLAMSATPEPPTPEQAKSAGCDVLLPKPLDPAVLLEQLRVAFRNHARHKGDQTDG